MLRDCISIDFFIYFSLWYTITSKLCTHDISSSDTKTVCSHSHQKVQAWSDHCKPPPGPHILERKSRSIYQYLPITPKGPDWTEERVLQGTCWSIQFLQGREQGKVDTDHQNNIGRATQAIKQ